MTKLQWHDYADYSVTHFQCFGLYVTKRSDEFEVELSHMDTGETFFSHRFKAKDMADAKRLGLCTAVDWFQGLAIALKEMIPFVPMDELIDNTYKAADDEPA